MAGTNSCRTCGQVNAAEAEYCVRCGERLPDASSTQLVTPPPNPQEYPWEPPAEWDPGHQPAAGSQTPAPTWVGRGSDQVGWNTGHDTGAGAPPPPAQWDTPAAPPPQGKPSGSKKPLFIGLGAIVVIAAVVVGIVLGTGGSSGGGGGGGGSGGGGKTVALNGVEKETGAQALTSARVALRGATSTHLTGTVTSDGSSIQLDLTLSGDNSQGTLTINNNDVQLIKVGDTVFIKGDPGFLKQFAGNDTAVLNALNGKWLQTPSTSDFDNFTIEGFANELKAGSGGDAVNGAVSRSTVNGKPVAIITQHDGSTLTIADTGTPFPLTLSSKGSDGGQLTFSDYNKPVTISAPDASQVLDVNALGSYSCPTVSGGAPVTLSLLASGAYTVSNATGGFWAASGNTLAFSGGEIDKYTATQDSAGSLAITGATTTGTNSFTCTKK
jgi:hypothetical protein